MAPGDTTVGSTPLSTVPVRHPARNRWPSDDAVRPGPQIPASVLAVLRVDSVAYLGERRDETTACRAALGERFLRRGPPFSNGRLKWRLKSAESGLRTGTPAS